MKMKCYLDANIIIYLMDQDSPFGSNAYDALEELINKQCTFYISPLVIDEFLYGLRNVFAKQFPAQKVANKLRRAFDQLLVFPDLDIIYPVGSLKAQARVIDLMEQYHLSPRDAYHVFTMKTNSISHLVTADQDFIKNPIPDISVIPVKS